MKTAQIIELLKIKHEGPEWACFVELPEATGISGRRMDFYAFNMWPSKRFVKIAYEVKISRADFARELKNPLKREAAEVLADECYFVCPVGMVTVDEIPEGWGLIDVTAGGLRKKKNATQRKVETLPIDFVASIARRSEDEPSPLPKMLWLYEGEELSLEQLLTASKINVDAFGDRMRRVGEYEARKSDEYKKLLDMKRIIQKNAGYQVGSDPEKLEEWIEALRGGTDRNLLAQLRSLRTKIDEILG